MDKSNTNINLPNILVSNDGEVVETIAKWEGTRKNEIIKLFEENVYGTIPPKPENIYFEVVAFDRNALDGRAHRKEVVIWFDDENRDINLKLLIYKTNKKEKGTFLGLSFLGNNASTYEKLHVKKEDEVIYDEKCYQRNCFSDEDIERLKNPWPLELIMDEGFNLVTCFYESIIPDKNECYEKSVERLSQIFNGKIDPKKTGTVSLWSWCMSRIMDYLVETNEVDTSKVNLFGTSRLGKTSIWAGANDERFNCVIANVSGSTGAGLARMKIAETITQINKSFPHWFCEKYKSFNDKEDEMPVDQHMLLASILNRKVYVSCAIDDEISPPDREYASVFATNDVLKLYGYPVFESKELPLTNEQLVRGNFGFHIRSGGHGIQKFDFEQYIKFV